MLLAAILAALLLVGSAAAGPGVAPLVGGDAVETLFQALVTAIITGVTLVLAVNQLVLSQELGSLADQRDRLRGALDYREDADDFVEGEQLVAVRTYDGGRDEVLAVLLMAAKYDVPVCPHAGGVGLCEYVQHLSIFDYLCVSASLEDRVIEYVDHLHEHFEDPVTIRNGRYMPPTAAGYSITMKPESRRRYAFPNGEAWKGGEGVSDPHDLR